MYKSVKNFASETYCAPECAVSAVEELEVLCTSGTGNIDDLADEDFGEF